MLNQKTILELEKRLEAEHLEDKKAIKRVLRLLRKQGLAGSERRRFPTAKEVSEGSAEPPQLEPTNGKQNGGVEKQILQTIEKLSGPFTLAEVLDVLSKDFPDATIKRSTVSSVIFRYKDKKLRIVTAGRGRRAAIYERII